MDEHLTPRQTEAVMYNQRIRVRSKQAHIKNMSVLALHFKALGAVKETAVPGSEIWHSGDGESY